MATARGGLGLAIDSYRQGKLADAVAQCEKLLRSQPRNFDAVHLLGVVRGFQGQLDQAADCFTRAVGLNPGSAEAFRNLGITQAKLGQFEGAVASYRQALALKAKPGVICGDLGRALTALGRHAEAADAFKQALEAAPDQVARYCDLAAALVQAGKHAEAVEVCRRGLAVAPSNGGLLSLLGLSQRRICDWSDLAARTRQLLDYVADGDRQLPPFVLLAATDDPAVHLAAARNFVGARPAVAVPAPRMQVRGKLRVGYLSADLHEHATAHLMAEMFERHDRERFDTFAFSHGPNDGSAMRKRLEAAFTGFFDVARESDTAVADRIRAAGIDVLVDLKGHTQDNRIAILAGRPAPMQVHYIGYPGTLGCDFIDYLIADEVVVPPGQQALYAEKLVYLRGSYQVNDSTRVVDPHTPSRADCKLPQDGFVFCCFNNSYKITPAVFDVWMRLLHAVPGAVLWLLADNRAARDNLWREAESRGIARERLVFAPRAKLAQHLARHRLADLFLDTLPYNAHTTASDALWTGLPVLTCAGRGFAARVAASLLHAVGLPELITQSLDEYERLALRLATDAAALADIRAKLARNLPTAPLFDAARTTRQIEAAYLEMAAIYRRGERPRSFAVS
jgi:protein O-GlcNAc transferase